MRATVTPAKTRRADSKRGDLTERLINILLLLAERPHSQTELATICRVNNVTIRRNLTELTRHYSIVSDREGREVVYRYSDNYEFRPPNLTPGELATLLLAQQTISSTGLQAFGTPFGGHGYTLLQKVRAALPRALREKLDALSTIFGSAAVPAKDYSKHTGAIDTLTNAAMSCRRVKIRYFTLHSGKVADRLFEPYSVYFDPDGSTLKVIGYDHQRKDIIPLSIDHILSITETQETFVRPPGYTLSGFLTENCFNGIHGEPLTVRLRATGVTARIFAEREFHPSQKEIERIAGKAGDLEALTIEMTVARGRGLERFILGWMPELEVVEPATLREKISAILDQSLRRNGGKN